MHSAFTPVELEWQGRFYTVPANKIMGLISRIEQFITLGELQTYAQRETVPLARLCSAYAAALSYAGVADVTAEGVYEAVFASDENRDRIIHAVSQMTLIMLPASARQRMDDHTGEPAGNSPAPRKSRGSVLLNRPSRSRAGRKAKAATG